MFNYTLDNKRYHTLNYFYRNKFKSKVFKISLNANFSCPNFKNGQGCIFCKGGSGNGYSNLSLDEQFDIIREKEEKKWPGAKYIAYFQANSNTYAPLTVLKNKFESMLKKPNVIGLAIATRSDCLSEEILDYLSDLNNRTFLSVEIGLQSMHNETLQFINRGHDLKNFEKNQ